MKSSLDMRLLVLLAAFAWLGGCASGRPDPRMPEPAGPLVQVDGESMPAIEFFKVRTDIPGARIWSVLVALPLVAPSYVVALTLAPRTPGWLRALGLKPMSLGLDRLANVWFQTSSGGIQVPRDRLPYRVRTSCTRRCTQQRCVPFYPSLFVRIAWLLPSRSRWKRRKRKNLRRS